MNFPHNNRAQIMSAVCLAITQLLALASNAFAQQPADQVDPVVVSPDMYRVLLENEHVRVVRYQIGPGARDEWHTHPAKVSYVVAGGTLRIITAGGESFVVEEDTNSATWLGSIGRHYAENIGQSAVSIVLVEIKSLE